LARGHIGAAVVAGVAVFAAGRVAGTPSRTKVVDYFHIATGAWTSGEIPGAVLRDDMTAAAVGNLALFSKGSPPRIDCRVDFHRQSLV